MMRAGAPVSALAVLMLGTQAWSQPKPPAMEIRKTSVTAAAAGGQQALTVEAKGGALRAGSCGGAGPCATGEALAVPERFRAGLDDAKLEVLALAGHRSVVRVTVPDAKAGQGWVALVAGPVGSGGPKVLFAEVADTTGSPAATEGHLVQVVDEGATKQVVVGTRSGEIHLCGRPSVLNPKLVDPTDLTLKPARLQRLSREERGKAKRVVAERLKEAQAPPLGRLLHAIGASSGLGGPGALTDGDPETSWSEGRGGDGRGEFAVMRVPKEVPLVAVTVTVRPPSKVVENGAAPKRFYLVDDEAAFEVVLPEDAWMQPGARYRVALPEPRATSCLALVLDEAYSLRGDRAPAVTVAEIEARSALDGQVNLDELVQRLERGGTEARAAAATLVRGGAEARAALARGYEKLNEGARLLALDALDQGTCEESSPLYVRALSSKLEQEARHARTRVERCRRGAVEALKAAVRDPGHPSRRAAAVELALLSPDEAIPLLSRLDPDKDRKAMLTALGKAASAPRGRAALAAQLAAADASPRSSLDLLRAAGAALADPSVTQAASQALGRVVPEGSSFEQRYLALGPAAVMAQAGDERALGVLGGALSDASVPLRSGAVAASGPVASLRPRLLGLSADPEPRVREALAQALASGPAGADERKALLGLLADEWTFVRAASYDALAVAGPDAAVDAALVERLSADRSPIALARAIEAAGRRHIAAAAPKLSSLLADGDRPLDVRARSARALGSVCHRPATDRLTELARAGAVPLAEADAQILGGAALVALGRLHPPDLPQRLAPLLTREAPRVVAMAARAALEETDRCP